MGKNAGVGLLLVMLVVLTGCGDSGYDAPVVVGRSSDLRPAYPRPTVPPVAPQVPYKSGSIKGRLFIIDAGHGGKDPGARGLSRAPEKTINIATASKLAYYLRQKGAEVVMSRDNDTFVELDDRAALADSYKADALISIHADWCGTPSVTGASMYVARAASRQSVVIAESIEKEFRRAGLATRGVRRSDFRVLVKHSRPSTLIELGFLSNSYEASQLNTSAYQSKLARVIADGIENAY
ncbi:MAG: N-acetylmuramoyl-L-alanine amidase [Phycisphaerae bacterium]